jgi:hypothetical protein
MGITGITLCGYYWISVWILFNNGGKTMEQTNPKIRKVKCCATCEQGIITEDHAFPYVACTIYGNRHPGELCDYYIEE